jgi:hypothetical protein
VGDRSLRELPTQESVTEAVNCSPIRFGCTAAKS